MNSQVTVQNVTILAPLDSPNTDGIDPGQLPSLSSQLLLFYVIVTNKFHIPRSKYLMLDVALMMISSSRLAINSS